MRRLLRLSITGITVLQREGVRSFLFKTRRKIAMRLRGKGIHMPVGIPEAIAVDWSEPAERIEHPVVVREGPLEIAWIMSPPSATSGGHQNLFRFIDFAERAGHRCTIHFYTNSGVRVDIPAMQDMLRQTAAYPDIAASISNYDVQLGVPRSTQALFATGWETAYPAYLDRSSARRFYFVQDFEPSFYPSGSEASLADSTYRFGFHGITAGRWLAHKLTTEYSMDSDYFDFGSDPAHYSLLNRARRDEVFFYARPVTARRGFEIGIMALQIFAEHHPDTVINLAGWDLSDWHIPFKHVSHSGMPITELNALYNKCAAGLVISTTNMSLLPLELMRSGVTPVVNDAPNNRMVVDSPFIEYAAPTPAALSRAIVRALDREDQVQRSAAMSEAAAHYDWVDSGRQFTDALSRVMRG